MTSSSATLSDRQGFNRRWWAGNSELVIFRPTSAEEVIDAWKAVRIDASYGELQITCGRHCYEDFVYNNNTRFIIDMTGLRGFGIDPTYGCFIGVGMGNWDMYRLFNNLYKVTLPAGSCYSVGLGGHITGGGYGLLSRLHGLAIDYMSAADVVIWKKNDPMPKVVTASADQNSDLYWALRGGGGGNFGIITKYYFKNPPRSPQQMYTDSISYSWYQDSHDKVAITFQMFSDIIDVFYSTYCTQDPATWNTFAILHLNHKAAKAITISVFTFYDEELHGSRTAFEQELSTRYRQNRRRLASSAPTSDKTYTLNGHPYFADSRALKATPGQEYRQYTYLEGTQNASASGPNRFGKYKSAYHKTNFTVAMKEALYAHLQIFPDGLDMTQSLCQCDSYGGKVNTVASDSTAIYQRQSTMKLQYQTYWDSDSPIGQDDPKKSAAHVSWINNLYGYIGAEMPPGVYAEMGGYPNPKYDSKAAELVEGCYYNYPDIYLGSDSVSDTPSLEFAMKLYFGQQNLSKLVTIKQEYNGNDWFKSDQSIP